VRKSSEKESSLYEDTYIELEIELPEDLFQDLETLSKERGVDISTLVVALLEERFNDT
jgi:hypothetical protein